MLEVSHTEQRPHTQPRYHFTGMDVVEDRHLWCLGSPLKQQNSEDVCGLPLGDLLGESTKELLDVSQDTGSVLAC